jgi:hypothetical protein
VLVNGREGWEDGGMTRLDEVGKVALLMKSLQEQGFRGKVETVYGPNGPKHCHIHLYVDLEEVDERTLRQKLGKLGRGFLKVGRGR